MNEKIRFFEEIASNAHVALNVMQYDGWLLRFASGYTNRANSVSVLYPSTIDPDEKITYCEECYRRQNLPCVFKLTVRTNRRRSGCLPTFCLKVSQIGRNRIFIAGCFQKYRLTRFIVLLWERAK